MKKIIILLMTLGVSFNAFSSFHMVPGLDDAKIKKVEVSVLEGNLMFVASSNALYKSEDSGLNFKKVAVFKDEEVKDIFLDSDLADKLYLATSRHIFEFGMQQRRLFSASDEQIIFTVSKNKEEIYIGTSQGLYRGDENILSWRKVAGLDDCSVYSLDYTKEVLYAATNRGVYAVADDKAKRLFITRDDQEDISLMTKAIKVDCFDQEIIWLGTNKGLFVSRDNGITWNKFHALGLNNLDIDVLAQAKFEKDAIYIGTAKGFFRVDIKVKKAKYIFEGVYGKGISDIEFNNDGEVYLATSKGLFGSKHFASFSEAEASNNILEDEPAIEDIQQAALHYNEVHPNKIKKWRKGLKFRGFFPSLSLGYDKVINYDSGVDRYYVGPRDWDVLFSWNMGDLLWNSYEDDVDTRARLNTQLRLDILDEINRIYFERLRLKNEMQATTLNSKEMFQKSLRLKELTATLNGYTGGFFSQKLREVSPAQ